MTWVNPVVNSNWINQQAFVAELDPTGSKALFATIIAAPTQSGLAVDAAGNMYHGMSDNCAGAIVTPGAFQQTNHMQPFGCGNFASSGYVAKISAQVTVTVRLAALPSPVAAGQSVTLTATVTPTATYASVPTGTTEFQKRRDHVEYDYAQLLRCGNLFHLHTRVEHLRPERRDRHLAPPERGYASTGAPEEQAR